MEDISLKVVDLYELKALALGFDLVTVKDGKEERQNVVQGFINEPGVPEGVKRAINRIGRQMDEETKTINEQRQKIAVDETLTQESKTKLDQELLSDVITLRIDKADFSKIENLSLKNNYQLLYDKIFK